MDDALNVYREEVKNHSLDILFEIFETIDRNKAPERFRIVVDEIRRRQGKTKEAETTDVFSQSQRKSLPVQEENSSEYRIVFKGTLVKGYEQEQALDALTALFKGNKEKAERFFQHAPVVVAKNLTKSHAFSIQQRLRTAGLICQVEQVPPQYPLEEAEEHQQDVQITLSSIPITPTNTFGKVAWFCYGVVFSAIPILNIIYLGMLSGPNPSIILLILAGIASVLVCMVGLYGYVLKKPIWNPKLWRFLWGLFTVSFIVRWLKVLMIATGVIKTFHIDEIWRIGYRTVLYLPLIYALYKYSDPHLEIWRKKRNSQ